MSPNWRITLLALILASVSLVGCGPGVAWGELIREEIRQTVGTEEDLREELRYLNIRL